MVLVILGPSGYPAARAREDGLRARYLAEKGYWRVARGERTLADWDPGRDAGGVGKKKPSWR